MTEVYALDIYQKINEYFALVRGNGFYQKRRAEQARFWMYESINESLKNAFYEDEAIERLLPHYARAYGADAYE